ncbi:uncharacterized protein LOC127714418 isoform X2 [Mytilus californianus]|uniref:uncharacterized protein LOC127714418 isoform X2 n=1 Tax=Mytilus californianus TaxID=6549 RepID=UPI002247163A|nr:uncharacterized protein LOC127714418 isoform X2 [Mytilus californianus]
MSLSTLRKNFYRIATLIIDHGAESMRCLLDQFIQTKYRISFRDYVSNHQHEIYHHFNNGICCLCSKNYHPPQKAVISAWQMEKLFDKNSPKLSCHKSSSKCDYCCSTVKSTLQIQDIDITLLRFFLVTYFEEEFWQNCISGSLLFHDFLNTHKHDFFHFLQLNTPCCLCKDHPEYTTMLLTERDRLNKTEWETMFQVTELPCTQHRSFFPNGNIFIPCSVSARIGIRHLNLKGRARMIILSKFCALMRHMDELVKARNTVFAHAIKGELPDEDFRQLWIEIENSIIYVSNITNTVDSRKLCILELSEKSLEESMCLELQCLILKKMHGDELVLEACHKLQDTVEMVKEIIDLKLQQIELQITAFTSNMSDVVRNELAIKLNEYSDTTRNIIGNTKREIESHDEDKTYVKTSAVTAATELLHSNNLLIIFGRAGSGKTSMALEIASLFHANGYIIMKLEQNLAKDFKTYFISKNKQLIIFEDLLGKADIRYIKDIHSNLLEVLKPHVLNGVSKFIITVRSYKSEDEEEIATYHQLLSEARVVNLNGSFILSDLEKQNILEMHAKHFGRDISICEIESIIATNSYLGFPQACRLFCSFEKFFKMGHAFFTSPTEELQKEISFLKLSGYTNIDSAIQYCVLVSLMLDSAGKGSFSENICSAAHESNDPFNKVKNINRYAIEYLYQSLFSKEVMITLDDVHEICKNLSDKYIKNDINSNTYTFQHVTVFEAVLSSYWHPKTMEDVIRYFQVNILAEYVRPFDSIVKDNKKYVFVPIGECTHLVKKMFEIFLDNYYYFIECFSLINQSKFTLNLFNLELDGWFEIEENVLQIEWGKLMEFTRPFNYKKENNQICGYVDKKYLIQRFMIELDKRAVEVYEYIKRYGCGEFVKDFNDKLTKRFQSAENRANCKWEVIRHFVRPTTIAIKTDQKGTVTKDVWLIYRLIDILLRHEPLKRRDTKTSAIKHYIEKYGCKTFVKYFNEKLMERFQTEESVVNCKWEVIDYFIRPTTFQIEIGQVGTVTKDDWLIIGLVNRLLKHERIKQKDDITWNIKSYIETYGCEKFVKDFNKILAERFKSKENVNYCKWKVIHRFIRPTTFQIETGQLGTVTKDDWLILGLVNTLLFTRINDKTRAIKIYIKKYGCETFVNDFNKQLLKRFQSEENVNKCTWELIQHFIRPTSFQIENGQQGTVIKDVWLIQRLIDIILVNMIFQQRDYRTCMLKNYIEKYGCEQFVQDFNAKLTEWFQSKRNVLNCEWEVVNNFIRPTTFNLEIGQVGAVTKDDWLIYRLVNALVKDELYKDRNNRTWEVKDFIEKYGCEQFVKDFNKKLTQCCQSEKNVVKCEWKVIDYFIRPSRFRTEIGRIGIAIDDGLLIHKLMNILVEQEPFKCRVDSICWVKGYIEKYGCEQFVKNFNEKLEEWIMKNMANCNWSIFTSFVRPKSCNSDQNIGICIDVEHVMKYLFSKLEQATNVYAVKSYINTYGSFEFKTNFNERLKEKVGKGHALNKECTWESLEVFFENAVENDSEESMLTRESDSDIGDLSDSDSSFVEYDSDYYDFYSDLDENSHSEDSKSDSS